MPEGTTAPNAGGIGFVKCYAFKSWLQEYAQKADLPAPEYHTVMEGPAHEPVFRSTVAVDGAKYDSLPGFFTRKVAEQSAAEAALMEILESIPTTQRIPEDQQTGLWNNLLQEYAQGMYYSIPSYTWTRQASGKAPHTCTVEIGGMQYMGHAGKTKKEAEIKAAWTALLAIKEARASVATKYIVVPGKRLGNEAERKLIETLKPLEVKKGGFKKKWNKKKFMNKNRQAVDVEKNEARAAGDASNVMSPWSQQSPQGPSSDIVMLKHDDDASKAVQEPGGDTVMLQPDKEARRAEPEPDTAKDDNQARRAEPEPDIAMLPPDNKARREEVPCSDTVMVQPDKEARRVEQEPSRDSAKMRPNEEAGCINQEQLGETAMPQHVRGARTKKHDSQSRCNLM